jgi:hypothetical protein
MRRATPGACLRYSRDGFACDGTFQTPTGKGNG